MNTAPTALLGTVLGRAANRVKGLLIIVVAIDHNDWFRALAPAVFGPLTFHVLGFFLLAFSFKHTPFSLQYMADRAARYLLPFWWALGFTSLAYGLVYQTGQSAQVLLSNFALAAVIGSASLVKASSGLFMLWFLPCLLGLACLVAVHDAWRGKVVRASLFALALAAHWGLPYLPYRWATWVPFGLLIAAHVFVLGIVWRQLLLLRLRPIVGPMALLVSLFCYGVLVFNRVHIEIGTFEIAALQNPVILLLHGVLVYSAMLALVWIAGFFNTLGWLASLGENSLLVYLIHPVFYLILSKIWVTPAQGDTRSLLLLFHACATTLVAISLAYGASLVVTRSNLLSDWVTPRNMKTWPPVAYLFRLKKI